MQHELHFPILKELGLSDNEALLYELLLESGAIKARDLVTKTGIGRGNVYNILKQLQSRGLVSAIEGKQLKYEAVDPSQLRNLLELRIQESKRLESDFAESLPLLASTFNLSTGRPTMQLFEGIDGAKKALYETLRSKTEILAYFDLDALKDGPGAAINKGYVQQRIAKKIPKRIIVADTSAARDFFEKQNTPYTTVAFIKGYLERHATALELYDDTVTYLTLADGKRISLLIKDANIYQMHKNQFEFLWGKATEVIDYAARRNSSDADKSGSNAT